MKNDAIAEDVTAISRIGAVQKILEVVCRMAGLGFTAVVRVTAERWVACAVQDEINFGVSVGGELVVSTTLCQETRDTGKVVAIDDVRTDVVYCNHPTPRMYGFQSYIAVADLAAGREIFGTLLGLNRTPGLVNRPETVEMFELYADLIAHHLDAQRRVVASEAALDHERKTAQFREQFMAVLGHDLRNPLAAVRSSADLLSMLPHDEETAQIVAIIQRSSVRMDELIGNVLDFARGRLGGGLPMSLADNCSLESALWQVVNELRAAWPGRDIVCDLALDCPASCDSQRIGQMMSNLIANALTHGDARRPVTVRARVENDTLELAVINYGRAIPPATLAKLFEPFVRGQTGSQQGLGLGLYISSEIARAHGGTLDAVSDDSETRFTFRMPMSPVRV